MTLSNFFFLNPKTQSDDGPLGGKQCPHKTEEAVFPKLSAISCSILTRHWICRDLVFRF